MLPRVFPHAPGRPVIHCFIGTKAQLIKLAPVMLEMRRRGIPFRDIDSGQHAETTRSLRAEFGLGEPDLRLSARCANVASVAAAGAWYARQWARCIDSPAALREQVFPGGGICLIHGDTLSTLLGCQLARAAGLAVGHVEAGLSSGRRLDPFPEEIIRGYCSKRADLLFAPFPEAEHRLVHRARPHQTVRLIGNTVADALRLFPMHAEHSPTPASAPFALVTCHRAETIFLRRRLQRVVELVNGVVERMRVVFVQHEPTRRQMARFRLDRALDPRVQQSGLLGYGDFIAHLRAASLVITDGGSIQEECALLGKPCLVLRQVSERPDGIGINAQIWRSDDKMIDRLVASTPAPPGVTSASPSVRIVDSLIELGFGRSSMAAVAA